MRIISGEKRGTVLSAIKGDWIRPTSDKVRGALFSSLLSAKPDINVFTDMFSGSGAVAIEALSRGIETVYLFDNNKKSIAVIRQNLKKTGYTDRAHLLFMSAQKGLLWLKENGVVSDVFFMDPPYKEIGQITGLMDTIEREKLLADDGIIMIEHDKNDIMPSKAGVFFLCKEKKYGNTVITLYRKTS